MKLSDDTGVDFVGFDVSSFLFLNTDGIPKELLFSFSSFVEVVVDDVLSVDFVKDFPM